MEGIEYSLERKVSTEWIAEGVYFTDKDKAYEELAFYKSLYPQEVFRIRAYKIKEFKI